MDKDLYVYSVAFVLITTLCSATAIAGASPTTPASAVVSFIRTELVI